MDSFGQRQGFLRGGLRQQDDKFVTAIATDQIGRTEFGADSFDGLNEGQIADGMPEGVVDDFEKVNIKKIIKFKKNNLFWKILRNQNQIMKIW